MGTQSQSGLYGGYLRNVQRYYERDPLVRASLQLLLSMFAVVFFAFMAIRPTLSTITTLLKKIEDQKQADLQLSTKLTQLAAAQQFLSNNGQELTTLSEAAVPAQPDVKRLAQAIELSANLSGVVITELTFQPSPLVGNKSSLSQATTVPVRAASPQQFVLFSISVGGGQNQLVDFFDRVEKLDRVVTLTNLVFSRPQTGSKLNLALTATAKGTAYYLAPQQ